MNYVPTRQLKKKHRNFFCIVKNKALLNLILNLNTYLNFKCLLKDLAPPFPKVDKVDFLVNDRN